MQSTSRPSRALRRWFGAASVLAAALFVHGGCSDSGGGARYDGESLTPLTVHWGGFRGTDNSGTSAETGLPTTWNESGTNIIWKVPVALNGASSPVIAGDRIFLTGADDTQRAVYCYDATNGALLWERAVNTPGGSPGQPLFNSWPNPGSQGITYAGSTVVMDGKRVYAIFGNGDCVCYDYDGVLIWHRNMGFPDIIYGHASSPVLYQDLLILQMDRGEIADTASKLYALNKLSGATVWSVENASRPVGRSYATPVLVSPSGVDQLVTMSTDSVVSTDPATGTEIWKTTNILSGDQAQSPIYANGVVIASAGATYGFVPTGTGTVTADWLTGDSAYISSPSVVADMVLLMSATWMTNIQFDTTTGVQLWQQNLTGLDATFSNTSASPVVAEGRVYVLSEGGVTLILTVDASSPTLVGTGVLDPTSTYYASPAIAHSRIYIRSTTSLYCIGL